MLFSGLLALESPFYLKHLSLAISLLTFLTLHHMFYFPLSLVHLLFLGHGCAFVSDRNFLYYRRAALISSRGQHSAWRARAHVA